MSHFTVTVITAEKPTNEILSAALQPFHEFECTGTDDQYVQDIDRTEEALAAYDAATIDVIKAPDGSLHYRFTDEGNWKAEFSKPGEYGRREGFIPPDHEMITVSAKEVRTAAQWIHDEYGWSVAGKSSGEDLKYGYIELDATENVVKCIDRTNPDKKWDWWTVGGRWSGHLLAKAGDKVDQIAIADLDIDSMKADAAAKEGAKWDKVCAAVADLPIPISWDAAREAHPSDIEAARTAYNGQPTIKALGAAFPDSWGLETEIKAATSTREAFCQSAADGALPTFALLMDGQWYERGEMGWFACVSNEKDPDEWAREFTKKVENLPPTSWLTVVDCHI